MRRQSRKHDQMGLGLVPSTSQQSDLAGQDEGVPVYEPTPGDTEDTGISEKLRFEHLMDEEEEEDIEKETAEL